MVFNVKKVLNVGLGLTLWRKGGKIRCERNERQIKQIYAVEGRFSPANVKTPTSTLIWRPYVHPSPQNNAASSGIDLQNMPLFPPPPLSRR
jgi:hypothetical protein